MPPVDENEHRYGLPIKKDNRIEPLNSSDDLSPAADVIRKKIADLYEREPSAQAEQAVVEATPEPKRSKHQQYMHELSASGKSLAEIQTAWHEYYQDLSDSEKHEVWDEFYRQYGHHRQPTHQPQNNQQSSGPPLEPQESPSKSDTTRRQAPPKPEVTNTPDDQRSVADIKQSLIEKIAGNNRKNQANVKSMLFGLGVGCFILLVGAFGFFNERFIAPFITPSTVVSSTPLIIDEAAAVSDEPKIIIPKINLEIPVVYGEDSIAENDVQRALEEGVLHYPITPEPGERGNSVFFGHSSNNIFNRGNYKFAFVLLNQLEEGDIFMLEKDGKRYVYRVFDKEVVPPTDFSVLDPHPDKDSIATLITCDPPGTSINRLAVYGEQISPDPAENTESEVDPDESSRPQELPSDAPTLWQRVTGRD